MKNSSLRVCYFGTYRTNYSRNRIMIDGLKKNGVEVLECQENLWLGIEDRIRLASGGWLNPSFGWRALKTYYRLWRKYSKLEEFDLLVVGYPGQLDVFLAYFLSRFRKKPLVWDIFMSLYLIALERDLQGKSPFSIRLLRILEKMACRLPEMMILDTTHYLDWFQSTHGIHSDRFRLVPTGADDRFFKPVTGKKSKSELFQVVYYGTFIPNHGVAYIVEAARLLASNPTIQFKLIGQGPDKPKAQSLAEKYQLTNLVFVDWMERRDLVSQVGQADICLGVFGTTPQSLMTVQNKIYEGLAMAKPVITGTSPAIKDAFIHRTHVYLCERANPSSLARAIENLYRDPELRLALGTRGYDYFKKHFTLPRIGASFSGHLQSLTKP
jgi:glycosyltransferase involved in cell wall biosynthesis